MRKINPMTVTEYQSKWRWHPEDMEDNRRQQADEVNRKILKFIFCSWWGSWL